MDLWGKYLSIINGYALLHESDSSERNGKIKKKLNQIIKLCDIADKIYNPI